MVIVVTVEAVDVQRDTGTLSEALHAVGDHFGAELAEELALQAKVDDAVGTVGEVDDGAGEGLVERSVGIAEAGKTGRGTEGLGKGVAKGNADILGGVVVINYRDKVNQSSGRWRRWFIKRTVKVALAVYGQTPARVLGQGMEHVVEEANSSVDGNLLRLAGLGSMAVTIVEETGVGVWGKAAAVKVEGELDLGLVGVAGESGPTGRLRGGHLESQLGVNEGC